MRTKKNLSFSGVYKEAFEGYITYKTALGCNIEYRETLALHTLNGFLNKYEPNEVILTEQMAYEYVHQNPVLATATVHAYECRIRQFALYLRNVGYESIYIYPEKHTKVATDFVPYIFSSGEILRIFTATDQIVSTPNNPHYKIFFQTLIRLLYCTGIRISEALHLKLEDVDFANNILIVQNSKGNVSRLVPFNEYIRGWLIKYQGAALAPNDSYFFESPQGGARNRVAVGHTFQNVLLPLAKIQRKPDNTGPRLHDIRHTYACHCLDKMVRSGADPFCALPYLSTYMGHKGIESTEKYLRLTADHFLEISSACHHIYEKGKGDHNE